MSKKVFTFDKDGAAVLEPQLGPLAPPSASLILQRSQEAIAELNKRGPLTKRMLMVTAAKVFAEQLPSDVSVAIASRGPAEFVQIARQPLKAAGLGIADDDLREVFGMVCALLSRRADKEGFAPNRPTVQ